MTKNLFPQIDIPASCVTKQQKEEHIIGTLAAFSTSQLVELWATMDQAFSQVPMQAAMVRGWLMEAIDRKRPGTIDALLEQPFTTPQAEYAELERLLNS